MISLSNPIIEEAEIAAAVRAMKSGMIACGPETEALEAEFAKLVGTKYAVAVNSGTAALHAALHAAGIGPGDEVITVAFTFVASANSVQMTGAVPVFVDIDPHTYNIDPSLIEVAITSKTKAILPVNLYGQPAEYEAINKIATKHGLTVIEDAAQSVNATYGKKISGSLAHAACFSLYATKNIMCGEGGLISTDDHQLYERMMQFRSHGQPMGTRYEYRELGFNYRLTDILAAIARVQLTRIGHITKCRQQIAAAYTKAFKHLKGIATPAVARGASHVYHQYTLKIEDGFKMSRDEIKIALEKAGIQSGVYYPKPLHLFPHLKAGARHPLPVTEAVAQQVLSLPVHPGLTEQDVRHIIDTVTSL